jgi:hypothetical protein
MQDVCAPRQPSQDSPVQPTLVAVTNIMSRTLLVTVGTTQFDELIQ